jgi:hypothetical protein
MTLSTRLLIAVLLGAVALGCPQRSHASHRGTHRHRSPRVRTSQKPAPNRYSWEGVTTDLTPISPQPYILPPTDPSLPGADRKQASYLRRMNLENGLQVHGTHWIARSDVRSRDLFILEITQSLEGGFDSVNLYDKGLLSWGIMQWAARYGSLQQSLIFVKRRLLATHRKALWQKTFVSNGLDVDSDGLILYGKPVRTAAEMRLAFRGSLKVGNFDPKLATHWAVTMARAGRQPAVAALQVAYAANIVDAVLQKRLAGLPYHAPGRSGLTVADLAANDPYTEALVFALWTNNPRHAFAYVRAAATDARTASTCDDPSLWTPGAFSAALLKRCRESRFGNWPRRAERIEAEAQIVETASPHDLSPFEIDYRTVLAARKAKRAKELASRHTQ